MRNTTIFSLLLSSAIVLAPFIFARSAAFADDEAARALAARFSGGAEVQTSNEEQRKAEEAEILDRARREADARTAEAKRAEDLAKQTSARETAQKEAARAVELKRRDEAAKAAEIAERERKAIDEDAAAKLFAERQAIQDAQNAAQMAEEARLTREREVTSLSEKLRRVSQGRPNGAMGLGAPPQEVSPPEAVVPAPLSDDTAQSLDKRLPPLPLESVRNATSVTVLLAMVPGTTGIRRGSKSADPVLCLDQWCYVSNGPGVPAKLMTRGEALGPINTLSLRAGACRQSLTCVYRGLDVAAYFKAGAKPAALQPVDLRYLHHDRRDPMPFNLSNSCNVRNGQLQCAAVIKGKDWTAWIVPEDIAVEAGPEALQAALASGLVATPKNGLQAASLRAAGR
jgi:hypothetical protein